MELVEIVNQGKWDDFCASVHNSSLFQSWLWGDVQAKLGTKVWRFGIKKRDGLVGIALVVLVVAKRGRFLHVRQGPVWLSNTSQSEKNWNFLVTQLKSLASKENCAFIRISPQVPNTDSIRVLLHTLNFRPAPIPALDAEICWVLDLKPTEAELLGQMRKTTRNLIHKAERSGVEIIHTQNIDAFLELYASTSKRHGFVPHKGIAEEFEIFRKTNQATLLLAKHQGEVLAGVLLLFHGNQAIYHHGASIPNHVGASYLLQWEAIKLAKKRGTELYNFWGIAPESRPKHPWSGISLFKRGFGGHEVQYLHAQDLPLSLSYWFTYAVEVTRGRLRGF